MKVSGNILKMKIELIKETATYFFRIGENEIDLNQLIGKKFIIKYLGNINCIKCNSKTYKSFAQGFCYSCFKSAPETEECVLRPELCKAHEGISRDMDYAKKNCLIDHYVYLAVTSGLKVGVTRNTQIPARWLDQGAIQTIILAKTPNRNLAGQIEVVLKKHIADKTNWRKLFIDKPDNSLNLLEKKETAVKLLPDNLKKFYYSNNKITSINYPIYYYPYKIKNIDLDRQIEVSAELAGIKGQYLIFKNNEVFNVRKYGGYQLEIKY